MADYREEDMNTTQMAKLCLILRGDLTSLQKEVRALRQRVDSVFPEEEERTIIEEKDEPNRNDPPLS